MILVISRSRGSKVVLRLIGEKVEVINRCRLNRMMKISTVDFMFGFDCLIFKLEFIAF